MNAQARRFPYLLLLVVNMPAILFCAGGLAVILGWLPVPTAVYGDVAPRGHLAAEMAPAAPCQKKMPGKARAGKKCAECGVIVSMRRIEEHDDDPGHGTVHGTTAGGRNGARARSIISHEIVVRLTDGSTRVIQDAGPADWRLGERLIIIDGAAPASR